jgi:hypothetical protein
VVPRDSIVPWKKPSVGSRDQLIRVDESEGLSVSTSDAGHMRGMVAAVPNADWRATQFSTRIAAKVSKVLRRPRAAPTRGLEINRDRVTEIDSIATVRLD